MTRIFIYEYVTGGGMLATPPDKLPPSLPREGAAMLAALAADFAAVPGVEVVAMRDDRVGVHAQVSGRQVFSGVTPEAERRQLRELAAACDWTIVIAPEIGGQLLDRCRMAIDCGGRLLGPDVEIVGLLADKQRACEWLRDKNVPVPFGIPLAAGERLPANFRWPAVLKPRDGAGSQGLRLVRELPALASALEGLDTPARLEEYRPGIAASVALLGGPAARAMLTPCFQRISADGWFSYQGGSLPLPGALELRAIRLAEQVSAALPPWRGYLGIDLVLGPDPGGADDCVIEVNPRLTTSYVGLRVAYASNLALAMLDIAEGRGFALVARGVQVQFTAAGPVTAQMQPEACQV